MELLQKMAQQYNTSVDELCDKLSTCAYEEDFYEDYY